MFVFIKLHLDDKRPALFEVLLKEQGTKIKLGNFLLKLNRVSNPCLVLLKTVVVWTIFVISSFQKYFSLLLNNLKTEDLIN